MVASQIVHGCLTDCAWLPHRLCMVASQIVHGCLTDCAWLPHRLCMVVSQIVHGCLTDCAWLPHRLCMVASQIVHGCLTDCAWLPPCLPCTHRPLYLNLLLVFNYYKPYVYHVISTFAIFVRCPSCDTWMIYNHIPGAAGGWGGGGGYIAPPPHSWIRLDLNTSVPLLQYQDWRRPNWETQNLKKMLNFEFLNFKNLEFLRYT